MLAEHPYTFLDLKLMRPNQDAMYEKLKCFNCKKNINISKGDDENLWFSPQFSWFCKSCLHPTDSDVQMYLDQMKQSKFNFPRYEMNNRIKNDAIKIRKNRSTAIKSFCYKNKDKHLRRKIFIQKWQWRLNEIRRVM